MKYLLTFLLIISTTSVASEPKNNRLPKENLSFEIVNSHEKKILKKDEFETTEEFNKRQEKIPEPKPKTFYIKQTLSYDADKQEYSFWCSENTSILKDDRYYVPRSGINSFGTEWKWDEKKGEIYELRYKCPKTGNISVKVPLIEAKEFRDDFIAILELKLTAQNWKHDSEYESAEVGKSFVDNYSINYKNATVYKVHYGQRSSSLLYKNISLKMTVEEQNKLKLKPIVRIEPRYPLQAARDGIEGYVILSFTINEVGSVTDVNVLEANPKRVFDREATRALRKWKYKPKIVEGKPQKLEGITERIDFNLNRE